MLFSVLDTLWGLADSYMGKNFKNHQDYIHDVMRANGMNQAMIYEGQLLIIPCEGMWQRIHRWRQQVKI